MEKLVKGQRRGFPLIANNMHYQCMNPASYPVAHVKLLSPAPSSIPYLHSELPAEENHGLGAVNVFHQYSQHVSGREKMVTQTATHVSIYQNMQNQRLPFDTPSIKTLACKWCVYM